MSFENLDEEPRHHGTIFTTKEVSFIQSLFGSPSGIQEGDQDLTPVRERGELHSPTILPDGVKDPLASTKTRLRSGTLPDIVDPESSDYVKQKTYSY